MNDNFDKLLEVIKKIKDFNAEKEINDFKQSIEKKISNRIEQFDNKTKDYVEKLAILSFVNNNVSKIWDCLLTTDATTSKDKVDFITGLNGTYESIKDTIKNIQELPNGVINGVMEQIEQIVDRKIFEGVIGSVNKFEEALEKEFTNFGEELKKGIIKLKSGIELEKLIKQFESLAKDNGKNLENGIDKLWQELTKNFNEMNKGDFAKNFIETTNVLGYVGQVTKCQELQQTARICKQSINLINKAKTIPAFFNDFSSININIKTFPDFLKSVTSITSFFSSGLNLLSGISNFFQGGVFGGGNEDIAEYMQAIMNELHIIKQQIFELRIDVLEMRKEINELGKKLTNGNNYLTYQMSKFTIDYKQDMMELKSLITKEALQNLRKVIHGIYIRLRDYKTKRCIYNGEKADILNKDYDIPTEELNYWLKEITRVEYNSYTGIGDAIEYNKLNWMKVLQDFYQEIETKESQGTQNDIIKPYHLYDKMGYLFSLTRSIYQHHQQTNNLNNSDNKITKIIQSLDDIKKKDNVPNFGLWIEILKSYCMLEEIKERDKKSGQIKKDKYDFYLISDDFYLTSDDFYLTSESPNIKKFKKQQKRPKQPDYVRHAYILIENESTQHQLSYFNGERLEKININGNKINLLKQKLNITSQTKKNKPQKLTQEQLKSITEISGHTQIGIINGIEKLMDDRLKKELQAQGETMLTIIRYMRDPEILQIILNNYNEILIKDLFPLVCNKFIELSSSNTNQKSPKTIEQAFSSQDCNGAEMKEILEKLDAHHNLLKLYCYIQNNNEIPKYISNNKEKIKKINCYSPTSCSNFKPWYEFSGLNWSYPGDNCNMLNIMKLENNSFKHEHNHRNTVLLRLSNIEGVYLTTRTLVISPQKNRKEIIIIIAEDHKCRCMIGKLDNNNKITFSIEGNGEDMLSSSYGFSKYPFYYKTFCANTIVIDNKQQLIVLGRAPHHNTNVQKFVLNIYDPETKKWRNGIDLPLNSSSWEHTGNITKKTCHKTVRTEVIAIGNKQKLVFFMQGKGDNGLAISIYNPSSGKGEWYSSSKDSKNPKGPKKVELLSQKEKQVSCWNEQYTTLHLETLRTAVIKVNEQENIIILINNGNKFEAQLIVPPKSENNWNNPECWQWKQLPDGPKWPFKSFYYQSIRVKVINYAGREELFVLMRSKSGVHLSKLIPPDSKIDKWQWKEDFEVYKDWSEAEAFNNCSNPDKPNYFNYDSLCLETIKVDNEQQLIMAMCKKNNQKEGNTIYVSTYLPKVNKWLTLPPEFKLGKELETQAHTSALKMLVLPNNLGEEQIFFTARTKDATGRAYGSMYTVQYGGYNKDIISLINKTQNNVFKIENSKQQLLCNQNGYNSSISFLIKSVLHLFLKSRNNNQELVEDCNNSVSFTGESQEPPKGGFNPIEKSKEQKGWNCFDIAVGLGTEEERREIVDFALKKSNEETFRNLLAPEIRNAAALTYVYMNGNSSEETMILPKKMRTPVLQKISNEYFNAHEKMKDPVSDCNNSLGFKDGNKKSMDELDSFFKKQENQQQHKKVYEEYKKTREQIFSPAEKAFNDYCTSEETYKLYISEYYGNNGWFAFQREENSTSMMDIVAKFLSSSSNVNVVIAIHDTNGKEIHRTKNKAPNVNKIITVTYRNNNHFEAKNNGVINKNEKEPGNISKNQNILFSQQNNLNKQNNISANKTYKA